MYTGSAYAIDGCATFYKKERFTLVKKYEVEFNKAALSLAEQVTSPQLKQKTTNRLLKVRGKVGEVVRCEQVLVCTALMQFSS